MRYSLLATLFIFTLTSMAQSNNRTYIGSYTILKSEITDFEPKIAVYNESTKNISYRYIKDKLGANEYDLSPMLVFVSKDVKPYPVTAIKFIFFYLKRLNDGNPDVITIPYKNYIIKPTSMSVKDKIIDIKGTVGQNSILLSMKIDPPNYYFTYTNYKAVESFYFPEMFLLEKISEENK